MCLLPLEGDTKMYWNEKMCSKCKTCRNHKRPSLWEVINIKCSQIYNHIHFDLIPVLNLVRKVPWWPEVFMFATKKWQLFWAFISGRHTFKQEAETDCFMLLSIIVFIFSARPTPFSPQCSFSFHFFTPPSPFLDNNFSHGIDRNSSQPLRNNDYLDLTSCSTVTG